MRWTADRVEILTDLWMQGITAAEISKRLGNTTRNAVIGKVHRLGLSNIPRGKPKKDKDTKSSDVTEDNLSDSTSDEETEIKVKKLEEMSDLEAAIYAEKTSKRLSMMELTDKTCKWPIGDPAKPDFWFCGHPTEPDKPYCGPHNKIAEQPLASKREKKTEEPQGQ